MSASLKLLGSTFHPPWLLQGCSLASTLRHAVLLPGTVAVHQSHMAMAWGKGLGSIMGWGWGLCGPLRAGWGLCSCPQYQAGCPMPRLGGSSGTEALLHPALAWPGRSRGLLMEGHSEAINPPSQAAAHTLAVKS